MEGYCDMSNSTGDYVYLKDLGTVQIVKVLPSSAAHVRDESGRIWIVPFFVFSEQEVSLFSFVPDGPATKKNTIVNGGD
jgi:hypothetical protein